MAEPKIIDRKTLRLEDGTEYERRTFGYSDKAVIAEKNNLGTSVAWSSKLSLNEFLAQVKSKDVITEESPVRINSSTLDDSPNEYKIKSEVGEFGDFSVKDRNIRFINLQSIDTSFSFSWEELNDVNREIVVVLKDHPEIDLKEAVELAFDLIFSH